MNAIILGLAGTFLFFNTVVGIIGFFINLRFKQSGVSWEYFIEDEEIFSGARFKNAGPAIWEYFEPSGGQKFQLFMIAFCGAFAMIMLRGIAHFLLAKIAKNPLTFTTAMNQVTATLHVQSATFIMLLVLSPLFNNGAAIAFGFFAFIVLTACFVHQDIFAAQIFNAETGYHKSLALYRALVFFVITLVHLLFIYWFYHTAVDILGDVIANTLDKDEIYEFREGFAEFKSYLP